MNVIGLYGAIGWNVLISDNPKLRQQAEESWTHGASVTLFLMEITLQVSVRKDSVVLSMMGTFHASQ